MIKTILLKLLICLILLFGDIPAIDSITVFVEINGFRNENGFCRLLLFESEQGFPDTPEEAELMLSSKIVSRNADFIFKIIPGKYAIAILHDENSDGKINKTWYGKPKEGFGVSNNPEIGFSSPRFSESVLNLDEKNNYIKIKLNYL
jgi:uncharacterized protein (DUF2141 family)